MKIVTKELDDKDKKILQLIQRRVSYRSMSKIVFLSEPGIKHRIKIMKRYYSCESLSDLIVHLTELGII